MQYLTKASFKSYCEGEHALSICFSGSFVTEKEYPDAPYACFLELGEKCAAHQCHLHIYSSSWDENRLGEYIAYAKENNYFHMHKPVQFHELKNVIAQYDYGIVPTKSVYRNMEISGYITRNKTVYAVTNKMYDYLDAGLPIIAATPEKFVGYFEKENVLLNWTIEEYDFDEMLRRRDEMHENAKRLREKLRISNKIDKLIGFYEAL